MARRSDPFKWQPCQHADLALAALTMAWHYALRVPGHDKAAEAIERAMDRTAQLRERVRPPRKSRGASIRS